MKKSALSLILLIVSLLLPREVKPISHADSPTPFICGADLSFVAAIEAAGGIYYDERGAAVDVVDYLEAQGVNMVRLRLWHTPADGHHGLSETLAMATRIQAAGMAILLDIHYSDTWADPAHQTKPAAWETLTFGELTDAVYTYTRDVIQAFYQQGTPPTIVQIGNEITYGLLWDEGRVTGDNWQSFLILLQAAAWGVEDGSATGERPHLMLHIDAGGDPTISGWFFDHIGDSLAFDLIGLSYYPWWHGPLDDLAANMAFLADRYHKPMVIVETAYPWTLAWADDTPNPVGEARQLHDDYPATPHAQADFLAAVLGVIRATPDGLGWGMVYWEPAAIPASGFGSPWENLALFDFAGRPLPALGVFGNCGYR